MMLKVKYSPMYYIKIQKSNDLMSESFTLHEKCPNTELFLVRIFLYFDQK